MYVFNHSMYSAPWGFGNRKCSTTGLFLIFFFFFVTNWSVSAVLSQLSTQHGLHPPWLIYSPSGVGDVDPSQVDALTAHDEECGEAEQRDAAADHRQLGRLAGPQLQLLDYVAAQDNAHASARHDNHTWTGRMRWGQK